MTALIDPKVIRLPVKEKKIKMFKKSKSKNEFRKSMEICDNILEMNLSKLHKFTHKKKNLKNITL